MVSDFDKTSELHDEGGTGSHSMTAAGNKVLSAITFMRAVQVVRRYRSALSDEFWSIVSHMANLISGG